MFHRHIRASFALGPLFAVDKAVMYQLAAAAQMLFMHTRNVFWSFGIKPGYIGAVVLLSPDYDWPGCEVVMQQMDYGGSFALTWL